MMLKKGEQQNCLEQKVKEVQSRSPWLTQRSAVQLFNGESKEDVGQVFLTYLFRGEYVT